MYQGERMNSISHLAGLLLALAGLVLLVVPAGIKGDPWKIVSFSIYGVSLVILYSFSTLYHSFRGKAKLVFQKLDHSAIYLLIAGTYTPFMLVSMRGTRGSIMLCIVWALAVFGLLQDVLLKKRNRIFSVSLYVVMGWLSLLVIGPLARVLPAIALVWLVSGGVLYSVGVVFYALGGRLSYSHPIFHLFVLGGSIFHYITVLFYVA